MSKAVPPGDPWRVRVALVLLSAAAAVGGTSVLDKVRSDREVVTRIQRAEDLSAKSADLVELGKALNTEVRGMERELAAIREAFARSSLTETEIVGLRARLSAVENELRELRDAIRALTLK